VSSLRARLVWFYGALVVVVLCAFATTVWAIIEAQEATESPEVARLEGPDYTGQRMAIALALALPVGVAVAVIGGVAIARRSLQPLDDVVSAAARISTESLSERIAERPGAVDEMARLTRALNVMLERLEKSVDGMRRFTADASHELRTPLATMMSNLELAVTRPRSAEELRGTAGETLEELGRLSQLVESLLTLARSDAGGLPLTRVDSDLSELVARAVEPYRALVAERQVTLTVDTASLRAPVDPLWIGRVIANLVDNAAKLTPAGGRIQVALAKNDGAVEIAVEDSGPGVASDERARIFERFYRGEAARAASSGFGLGLALGREIARAHGGELALAPSAEGARFVLSLPAAPG
jgi:two-component system OmpR family sensor kinase